jgi:hypothetical protein
VAPWYSDQVLPFDVTLAGANEYGAMACAKIFGIEILNEGSGVSIDDAVTEMQATFVARAVEPMTAVQSPYLPSHGFFSQRITQSQLSTSGQLQPSAHHSLPAKPGVVVLWHNVTLAQAREGRRHCQPGAASLTLVRSPWVLNGGCLIGSWSGDERGTGLQDG